MKLRDWAQAKIRQITSVTQQEQLQENLDFPHEKETESGEEEELFETEYTKDELEEDLDYHDEEMENHEVKFQNHSQTRRELLRQAAQSSGLKRKRLILAANRQKKQAQSSLQKFNAHHDKFETKMEWDTVSDVSRIQADEEANVPVSQVSEDVAEFLNENGVGVESVEDVETQQAVNRVLQENEISEGLEEERRIVEQLEKGELEEDELDLEMRIDELEEDVDPASDLEMLDDAVEGR